MLVAYGDIDWIYLEKRIQNIPKERERDLEFSDDGVADSGVRLHDSCYEKGDDFTMIHGLRIYHCLHFLVF